MITAIQLRDMLLSTPQRRTCTLAAAAVLSLGAVGAGTGSFEPVRAEITDVPISQPGPAVEQPEPPAEEVAPVTAPELAPEPPPAAPAPSEAIPAADPAPAPAPPSVAEVPVDDPWVTNPFGERYGVNPLLPPDVPEFHNGVDIGANTGTPIHSIGGGTVKFSDWHQYGGIRTEILHDDGSVSTYSHQNASHVSEGDRVEYGQIVGEVGATGNANGPHLHFELYKGGQEVDPQAFLGF